MQESDHSTTRSHAQAHRLGNKNLHSLWLWALAVVLTTTCVVFAGGYIPSGANGDSVSHWWGALNLFGIGVVALLVLRGWRHHHTESVLRSMIAIKNQQLDLISATTQMMELLQVCHSQSEMAGVISSALPDLFSGLDGALYAARGPECALECLACWGPPAAMHSFGPTECWALRRGSAHVFEPSHPGVRCAHGVDGEQPCLCVPLVADGNAIGVLHLRAPQETEFPPEMCRLAKTLAKQLSLAFGNLRLQETLRAGAERDPLTELYNRRHLEISLLRELARAQRHAYPVSVIMLDVDHFKNFNDSNGHEAGDAVLREVSQVLRRHTRAEDVACRWGGEEFLMVLPGCAIDDAYAKAEAIREAIAQLRVSCRGTALPRVTASLGIACFPANGERVEDLINSADTALYHAKAGGRNTVVATDPPGEVVLFEPLDTRRSASVG